MPLSIIVKYKPVPTSNSIIIGPQIIESKVPTIFEKNSKISMSIIKYVYSSFKKLSKNKWAH